MDNIEKIYIRQQFVEDCVEGNLKNVRQVLLEIYNDKITKIEDLPLSETHPIPILKSRTPVAISITNRFFEYYHKALVWACSNNHLNLVKYLLNNKDFDQPVDIYYKGAQSLKIATQKGHLEIVHYLLNRSEIKPCPNISLKEDLFLLACLNGRLNMIKYLTESEDLKEKVNISKLKIQGFKNACSCGKLNVIDYFVHNLNPEFKVDVNTNHSIGFILAYKSLDLSAIQFLALNCNLRQTKYVNRQLHLKKKKNSKLNEDILNVFYMQNLYDRTDSLVQNRVEKKKLKI